MTAHLEVLDAGLLTTVQDLGRPGLAHLGVPRSGALDVLAHRLANALVGNSADAATLEVTAAGSAVRFTRAAVVAVTGAPCPVWVGSVPAPHGSPVRLAAGQALELGAADLGVRSYIAIDGGIAVDPVLDSRATDTLSGLGPAPLAAGQALPLAPGRDISDADFAALRQLAQSVGPASPAKWSLMPRSGAGAEHQAPFQGAGLGAGAGAEHQLPSQRGGLGAGAESGGAGRGEAREVAVLRFTPGPRDDWFAADALAKLCAKPYVVSDHSNRIGLRLEGEPLMRANEAELPSEGMPLGAIQVPPSGQPVVFLADHPTTGGYPVIGVIDAASITLAAQAAPGTSVRFDVAD